MIAFAEHVWIISLALAPWLLLGAAIAGVLHVVLPPNFVRNHLRGRAGVAKAVALGVPLPLCSCGVIPTGLGLKKDGASDGATVGFLISTPQTGVDSMLVSAAFLGWPFALFKVASAAITGLVGGLIADKGHAVRSEVTPAGPAAGPERTPRAALAHAIEVLQTIWRWLVFGVLVSAAINVFVPPSWLQGISGHGEWLALLAALLVSLPLYVCATASVPIAAALVAGGFPPGAALVFLMAGPATNVATLGAVYRALGRRTLVVYLSTIVVGSLVLGWAFDFVISRGDVALPHQHGDGSLLATLSVVVFSGLLARFAYEDVRAWWRSRRPTVAGAGCTIAVGVEGMTCQGCVRKLEDKLREQSGVETVRVELEDKRAEVTGEIDESGIRAAIRAAGFTPV